MKRSLAIVACLMAIGCGERKPTTAAAPQTWSGTPTTFAVGPAPSSRPASPQYSLDQLLDKVAATPQQRAAVAAAMKQASQDWQAWYVSHTVSQDELIARMRAAAAQHDDQEVARLFKQGTSDTYRTIPKSKDACAQIKRSLDPQQQEKLQALGGNNLGDIGKRLHESMGELPQYTRRSGPSMCMTCHLPQVDPMGTPKEGS